MNRSLGTLGVLVALAFPGLASAQSYPFETIARGSSGGPPTPLQALIQSEQELIASGSAGLIPPGVTVDFSRDALLVARMGMRPTGGYGIEIRAVEAIPPAPSVPGGPAISLTTVLEVQVFSRSPGPGEIVTQAFTSPYHVVKVPRPAMGGLVARFAAQATSVEFDAFRRSEGSLFHAKSIEVTRAGAVSIYERAPGSQDVTNVTGQISPAQVTQLRMALAQVDFPSVPADLGDDPSLMDAPAVSYVLTHNGADQVASGMKPLISQALRDRLQPLDATLEAIRSEVLASLPTFDTLSFSTRTPLGADAFTQTITILADGSARVEQGYLLREVLILPKVAQLSSDELRDLAFRVRMARMNTLPAQLPTPVHIAPPVTFALSAASQNPDNAGATAGEPGYYEGYAFRLERLVAKLTELREQVIQTGAVVGDDEFKGEVVLEGGEVKLRGPQESYTLRGDLAATIRRFRGETVKVSGQRGAAGELQVVDVLYPVRNTALAGSLEPGAGRPRLLTAGSSAPLYGPAARALHRAGSNLVVVDGWVFSDLNTNTITKVYLEAVRAKVTRFSILTRSGAFQGVVRAGDDVQVLGLSRSGRYARVKRGDVEGYMRVSRLRIGEPIVALATPGLSGSLPQ
ncbi:MAG: protease complex subunit PrcB family protein [Planctomycetes bacterium]|nr:protease complex subunit PrcB family protein [Planctomycetota bacterium]